VNSECPEELEKELNIHAPGVKSFVQKVKSSGKSYEDYFPLIDLSAGRD
jgi:hypothetical protein